MSGEVEQIKIAYETLGMTPEQISEDRELDITAVKAALMQGSSVYRRQCGEEPDSEAELNFSDDQLQDVNKIIYDIAIGSEDDNVRLKAAMYIRDDKKGRKEVVKQLGGQQFNMLMFNEAMQAVRAGADKIKQKVLSNPQEGALDV